jgi:hypothetical protein
LLYDLTKRCAHAHASTSTYMNLPRFTFSLRLKLASEWWICWSNFPFSINRATNNIQHLIRIANRFL